MFANMSDSVRVALVWALCIFGTVTSASWAAAFTKVYAPADPNATLKSCSWSSEARSSAFCMELARGQRP